MDRNIIIGVLIFLVVLFGVYYFYPSNKDKKN